jgi:cyclase
VSAPSLHAPARGAPDPELVEVADAVFAYVQPPGGWCLSNAGVLVGDDGAVVVDTLATEARARRLLAAVDDLHPGPGRTLVNTHHHGDHTFGNHLFGRAALIVAHDHTRREMAHNGLALTGLWPDVEWGDVRITLPTLTFHDQVTLHLGERRVELLFVGPAHTTGDVVVWLPDEKVLFSGDVVLSGSTPFNLMGSIAGALAAVERLAGLGAETVVCGHGPVAGPDVFDQTTRYLRWIQEQAAEGLAQGLSPLELAHDIDLGESAFAHLLDPERIVGNLHRAYAELAPDRYPEPEPAAVFAEMIAYNHNEVPQCLA